MKKTRFFYIFLVLLALTGAGCTVRITWEERDSPQGTPLAAAESPTSTTLAAAETPTSTPPPAVNTPRPTPSPTATRTPTPTPVVCTSPVEPGAWTGEVELQSTGSRSGFQIIQQQAGIQLDLEIGCLGKITGTASRTGEASISVPILVNGTCEDQVRYNVMGHVFGTKARPELEMRFTVSEGSISCDVRSRTSQVPSGEESTNLRGYSYLVQVFPNQVTETRLEGDSWPDRLYQDQLPTLEDLIADANLEIVERSTWYLERR